MPPPATSQGRRRLIVWAAGSGLLLLCVSLALIYAAQPPGRWCAQQAAAGRTQGERERLLEQQLLSRLQPAGKGPAAAAKAAGELVRWRRQASANLTAFQDRLLHDVVQLTRSHRAAATTGGAAAAPLFASMYDTQLALNRFDPFNPIVACPPGRPLTRYPPHNDQPADDGTKLLCDFSDLAAPAEAGGRACTVVSVGSRGDFSFEQAVLNHTRCHVATFDCTFAGSSVHPGRHTYQQVCIGDAPGPNFQRWRDVAAKLAAQGSQVNVLKIDIEGYETSLIADLASTDNLPEQTVVEMHFTAAGSGEFGPPAPKNSEQMALLFGHMAHLGYAVVAREDNTAGTAGCCAEFTFLRVR